MSDLSGLKPGDEVASISSSHDRHPLFDTVERLTPTQIVGKSGYRYYRGNGKRIGYSGAWLSAKPDVVQLAREVKVTRDEQHKRNFVEQEARREKHRLYHEARDRVKAYLAAMSDAMPSGIIHAYGSPSAELRVGDLRLIVERSDV